MNRNVECTILWRICAFRQDLRMGRGTGTKFFILLWKNLIIKVGYKNFRHWSSHIIDVFHPHQRRHWLMSILEVTLSCCTFFYPFYPSSSSDSPQIVLSFNHASLSTHSSRLANYLLWMHRCSCPPFCLWPSWRFAQRVAIVWIQSLSHFSQNPLYLCT